MHDGRFVIYTHTRARQFYYSSLQLKYTYCHLKIVTKLQGCEEEMTCAEAFYPIVLVEPHTF